MTEYCFRVELVKDNVNNEQFVQKTANNSDGQGRYLIKYTDPNQTNKEIWKLCREAVFEYWPNQKNSPNKATPKDLFFEEQLFADRFLLFGKSCLLPFSQYITVEYNDLIFWENIQLYAGIFGDGECKFERDGSIVYIDLFLVPKYVNENAEGSSETALYTEYKSKLITPETAKNKIRINKKIEYKPLPPSEKRLNEAALFDAKLRSDNASSMLADRHAELGASARNAQSLKNILKLKRLIPEEGTKEETEEVTEGSPSKRHKPGGKRKSRKRRSRRTKRKTRK